MTTNYHHEDHTSSNAKTARNMDIQRLTVRLTPDVVTAAKNTQPTDVINDADGENPNVQTASEHIHPPVNDAPTEYDIVLKLNCQTETQTNKNGER